MKFHEFRGLGPDEKNMEILKMLPMLTPLTEEFSNLKNSLTLAIDKVNDIGRKCNKIYFCRLILLNMILE